MLSQEHSASANNIAQSQACSGQSGQKTIQKRSKKRAYWNDENTFRLIQFYKDHQNFLKIPRKEKMKSGQLLLEKRMSIQ